MSRKLARSPRGILSLVTAEVVAFSIAAMVLTNGILVYFSYLNQRAALATSLERTARNAAEGTERFLAGQRQFLEGMVWIEGGSLGADLAANSLLDGILGYNQAIIQVAAIGKSGSVIAAASRRSVASPSSLPYLREAGALAASGHPYLSPVYVDPDTAEPLITIGVASLDRFDGGEEVIAACLNLRYMRDLVAGLDVGKGGRAYVTDPNGYLIAYADQSKVLRRANLSRLPPVVASLAKDAAHAPGSLMSFRGIEGDIAVGAYIPLAEPSLTVVVELPWAVAYQDALRILLFGGALTAVMAAAIAVIGSALARSLSAPIQGLAKAVTGMAAIGRLTPVVAAGPREIVDLAGAFNAMAERLNGNEARLRRLLWNSSDIIAIADRDGKLSYVSSSIERIFGRTPTEMVGSPLSSFLRAEDVPVLADAFSALSAAPGSVARADLRMSTRSGAWIDVEMIGVNQSGDPVVGGMVLNLRDVSGRKEAERERNELQERLQHAMKMEAIGRLAGGVAHDINNILTGIFGSVQLALLDTSNPAQMDRYLREIGQWAENAASLTRQLLAYSRKQHIEPRPVDLNALVGDMVSMLPRILGEDIEVVSVPGAGLGLVRVDPGQIEQILVNLSANARDAMLGGGTLRFSTEAVDLDETECARLEGLKPGKHVRLTVADTGTGMDQETLKRIFEPFFTTKSLGKGTGLGSATVYGAVRQSGGAIDVRSAPGSGTSFDIFLPMEEGLAETPSMPAAASSVPEKKGVLLLVEDRPDLLKITVRMVSSLGYSVKSAGGGEEALSLLSSGERVDGIVTDVSMPGMNGIELAKRVQALRPGMKVLFISGYAEDVMAEHGSTDSLGRFLMKPFSRNALGDALKALFGDQ